MLFLNRLTYGETARSTPSSKSSLRQHYDAAYRFQSSGHLAQADSEYKLFLAEALHRLANGRANIGDYARAVPFYDEALKLAPDFAGYFDYAGAALDARDPSKARLLAQNALSLYSKNATNVQNAKAHLILGHALRTMSEKKEAIGQFKTAVALDPDFEDVYALGAAYLALPDKENAARTFVNMLAGFGDTAIMHMDLGRAYGEAGYPDEAIQEFKKAIAKNNRLPGAHYSLGASYINKSGEIAFSQAEPEFRKEVAIQPNDSFSYPQLGRIATARHRFQEAEVDLNRAITLNPKNPDTFFLLGELYAEMHRLSDAEAALRKAIAATTDPSENHYEVQHVHYRLGRLLIESGDIAEGKKEMQIAEALLLESRRRDDSSMAGKPVIHAPLLKTRARASLDDVAAEKMFENQVGPLIAGCYSNLGVNAAVGRDYAAAAEDFERAAQWNPALHGLDTNWGTAAFAARDYAQAVGPLSRSLQVHPEDVQIRSMLGVSEYMIHDYDKAVRTMRVIEAHVDTVPSLKFAYAESMLKTGDLRHGIERLQSLAQSDPENRAIHSALAEAYRENAQPEEADREAKLSQALSK